MSVNNYQGLAFKMMFCIYFFDNVIDIFDWWCGNTYLGQRKDRRVSKHFHCFFSAFYDFLIYCKNSSNKRLNDFAQNGLYQGTIYRYLGYASSGCTGYVIPEYDNIYVSWSKNYYPSHTILEKLDSYITKLECNISGDYYDIDLEGLGISRSNEREVVFPTIESMITNIEYLPVDEDDDSEDED